MTWSQPYASLPAAMRVLQVPEGAVGEPGIMFWNEGLANDLGLERDARVWSGSVVPDRAEPVALGYAGHQFGHLAMLGDGRAVLLGGRGLAPEGRVVDVQLKGSGRTPFARGGDGRAALGPMLREALFSEAMHALGVPTTRTLAVTTTGREADRRGMPAAWQGPGAVLTRVASSHLRVGSFVLASHMARQAPPGEPGALAAVADLAIARHDPDLSSADDRYPRLLERIVQRQARLVAAWMSLGFVHGVLNTDNVAVGGETIDYGPCAFLDAHDAGAVFSSIDRQGRYAYGNQPGITQWNLMRLAEAMLPLLGGEAEAVATAALDAFATDYDAALAEAFRLKLGLREPDGELVEDLLARMQARRLDHTETFRVLSEDPGSCGEALGEWLPRWRALNPDLAAMRAVNPATVPRTHHVDAVLEAAVGGDLTGFEDLLAACRRPFEAHPRWSAAPGAGAAVGATFCGT